jgi:Zn-dependent protease with chaperone function
MIDLNVNEISLRASELGSLDLECILGPCLDGVLNHNEGRIVIFLSFAAVIFSSYKVFFEKEIKKRLNWIYIGIFSVLFPIFFIAFSMNCHMGVFGCAGSALFYSIPLSFVIALVVGYVLMPFIYLKIKKTHKLSSGNLSRLIKLQALKNNIRKPDLYLFESNEPEAFSYSFTKPIIMVSTRMLEILTNKEAEAVLLHELGHIQNGSSIYKFAAFFAASLPFFSRIVDKVLIEEGEEELADDFAASTQGSCRYLNSARKKISDFYEFKREINK